MSLSETNLPADEDIRGEPITFGSTINLELHGQKDNFLHSEGFILSKMTLKSFTDDLKDSKNDFNYCNFRIIPFSTSSNFKTQIAMITKLIEKIEEFHEKSRKIQEEFKKFFCFLFFIFGKQKKGY